MRAVNDSTCNCDECKWADAEMNKTAIDRLQHTINTLRKRQQNMSYLESKKAREIQQLIINQSEIEDTIMLAEINLARLKGDLK